MTTRPDIELDETNDVANEIVTVIAVRTVLSLGRTAGRLVRLITDRTDGPVEAIADIRARLGGQLWRGFEQGLLEDRASGQ
ncbi:hypothetical protein HQ535_15595 [bacterium]|nr:hypothetical protein [bacterium]